MHTVRYFDGKTYEWVGISRQPNIIGKVCFELIILDYSFLLASLLLIDTNLWFPIVIDPYDGCVTGLLKIIAITRIGRFWFGYLYSLIF